MLSTVEFTLKQEDVKFCLLAKLTFRLCATILDAAWDRAPSVSPLPVRKRHYSMGHPGHNCHSLPRDERTHWQSPQVPLNHSSASDCSASKQHNQTKNTIDAKKVQRTLTTKKGCDAKNNDSERLADNALRW